MHRAGVFIPGLGRVAASSNGPRFRCDPARQRRNEPSKDKLSDSSNSSLVADGAGNGVPGIGVTRIFEMPIGAMRVQGSQSLFDNLSYLGGQVGTHIEPAFKHPLLLAELELLVVPRPADRTWRGWRSVGLN